MTKTSTSHVYIKLKLHVLQPCERKLVVYVTLVLHRGTVCTIQFILRYTVLYTCSVCKFVPGSE
jgi:hypothetical protein